MLFSGLKRWIADRLGETFHTPDGVDRLIRQSELEIANLESIIKASLDEHDGQGRYDSRLWAERLRRKHLIEIRDHQRRSTTQPIL